MRKTSLTSVWRPLAATSLLLLFVPVTTQAEQAPAAPQIEAKARILMDYSSGKVLAESMPTSVLIPPV